MKLKARIALLLALGLLVGLLGTVSSSANAATWTPPRSERLMSGPSRPGVAAWGLDYNNASGEMLVGDYVSSQVRRYSLDGVHLGDFVNPKGSTEGVASAVAVDPRNGASYLAVTGDGKTSKSVRKYDAAGNFLYTFDLSGSVTWLTVDDQGFIWQPQAFGGTRIAKWQVNDATKTATQVTSFGTAGTGPGQLGRLNGIAVAEAVNRVYVVDAGNGVVHCFSTSGTWLFDIGNRSIFPGDMRGVHVDDARSRVYVANSQAGTIEVFDLDGNWLFRFSALGTGPGQMVDGARGLAQTPDGDIWAADYGGRRVIRFTVDGALKSTFPANPAQPAPPGGLASARGLTLDPATNDIITVDGWNQRIQRFAPDGTLLSAFGRRGSFPPDGMNYPRSAAVDPATGNIWLGNYEGDPMLMVYDRNYNFIRQITTPRFVQDIEIVGNIAYVLTRRTTPSVRRYNVQTGALIDVCCTSLGQVRGIAVDPQTGLYWITSDTSKDVYVINSSGTKIRTLAVDNRGWGVDIVGDVVYVADASANKVIAFDRLTYARLGTFGSAGTLPGQMRSPSGITHDASGHIYVLEERGQRVQVFGWSAAPAPETTAPAITWGGDNVQTGQLLVKGTATDAGSGVAQVEVVVKDESTGLYYNGYSAVWANQVWNQAVASGPASSMTWAYTLPPTVSGRNYTVRMRARDFNGNVSPVLTRLVSVGNGEPPPGPDTVAPDTTITQPSFDSVLPHAPVTILGGSTDDIGVTAVEVAIQDRVTKKWWDSSTSTWATSQKWVASTLQAPGTLASPWSAVWDEPTATTTGGSGSYFALARGKDAAGNVETDRPSTRFTAS